MTWVCSLDPHRLMSLLSVHFGMVSVNYTKHWSGFNRRALFPDWEISHLCCMVHHRNIQLKSRKMIEFSKEAIFHLFFTFNLICQVLHCPLHSNLTTWGQLQNRSFQEKNTHEVHLEVSWDVELIRLVDTLCVRTEWGCCFLPRIPHLDEEHMSPSYSFKFVEQPCVWRSYHGPKGTLCRYGLSCK